MFLPGVSNRKISDYLHGIYGVRPKLIKDYYNAFFYQAVLAAGLTTRKFAFPNVVGLFIGNITYVVTVKKQSATLSGAADSLISCNLKLADGTDNRQNLCYVYSNGAVDFGNIITGTAFVHFNQLIFDLSFVAGAPYIASNNVQLNGKYITFEYPVLFKNTSTDFAV